MAEGATNFPTNLDTNTELPEPSLANQMNTAGVFHDLLHAATSQAIKQLEAKMGINNSAVATSIDYKLAGHQGNTLWVGQPLATANTTWVANEMRVVPFFCGVRITITRARFRVITASGNIAVALYDASGTRLVTSGAIASPSGQAEVALTSTTLTPGKYFGAISADNAIFTARTFAETIIPGPATPTSSHPCPATFTPTTSSTTTNPLMIIFMSA